VPRIIVLDAGPLGLASNARGKPSADECRAWLRSLALDGVRIVVPEIADFEVRRELLRVGATAGLLRLDLLGASLTFDPITTTAMRRAAEFWAAARRAGLPTADPRSLDADVILAAQADVIGGSDDLVIVATTNPGHLSRFVDARDWTTITPL